MLDSKQKTSGETADLRGGLEAADPATLLLPGEIRLWGALWGRGKEELVNR